MFALALAGVVVIAFLVFAATRTRTEVGSRSGGEIRVRGLDRWVAAGLITGEQARAITDFEHAERSAHPGPRVSPAVEALAYVGGVLLTVGAGMLVGQAWGSLGTAGHLGIIAGAAVLTGIVGAVVGESDPTTWRLRGFLWALSSVGVGAVAGLVAFEVLDASGEPVAFATAAGAMLASAAYWALRNRPLQHTITFVGTAIALGVGIAWAGSGNVAALIGLALWLLGAAWAGLGWRLWVPPARLGFALGVVLTLVASGVVGARYDWLAPVLGLLTASGWVAVGVLGDEGIALAPGVLGVFVFLPWALGRFFGETLGAPAIVMLSGVLLLAVVVLLLRRRRGTGPPVGGSGMHLGHFRSALHP